MTFLILKPFPFAKLRFDTICIDRPMLAMSFYNSQNVLSQTIKLNWSGSFIAESVYYWVFQQLLSTYIQQSLVIVVFYCSFQSQEKRICKLTMKKDWSSKMFGAKIVYCGLKSRMAVSRLEMENPILENQVKTA